MASVSRRKIGLFISNLADPYESNLIAEIEYFCKRSNYDIIVLYGGGMQGHYDGQFDSNPLYLNMDPKSLDGLIISAGPLSSFMDNENIEKFFRTYTDLPLIAVGNELKNIPSIMPDNFQGSYEITKHLITKHGARNIAFISGPPTNREANERKAGYEEALREFGLIYEENLIKQGDFFQDASTKCVAEYLEEGAEIDAIVCVNDESAWGALSELEKNHVHVPSQMMVTGFDDASLARFTHPPLTTVKQPISDLAWTAVNLLEQIWNGNEVPMITRVSTRLVVRRSCSCNALDEELLRSPYPVEIDRLPEALPEKMDYLSDAISRFIFKGIRSNELTDAMEDFYGVFSMSRMDDAAMIAQDLIHSFNRKLIANPVNDMEKRLTIVRQLLETLILESESRLLASERYMNLRNFNDIQSLGFELVKSHTIQELDQVLKNNLKKMGVNSFIIVLSTGTDNLGRVLFTHDEMNRFNLKQGDKINTRGFVPENLRNAEYQFYILPMLTDSELRGYCILEFSPLQAVSYFHLYNSIASAIKSSFFIGELERHTEKLKIEVERATEELTKANLNLRELSLKDTLTGLRNRRYIQEVVLPDAMQVQQHLEFASLHPELREAKPVQKGLAMYLVDLDHFKFINDTYGHGVGDEVLKHLAHIFQTAVRKNDVVVRWGGEEFLLVLRDFKEDHVLEIGEKLRSRVEEYQFTVTGNRVLRRTCSIGCVFFPLLGGGNASQKNAQFQDAVEIADKSLYFAKQHKRNQAVMVRLTDIGKSRFEEVVSQELTISESMGYVGIDVSAGKGVD